MAWLEGWSNRLKYTLDGQRLGDDMSDFPALVVLASGVGRNNFDASGVFDELIHTTGSGAVFEDDFNDGNDYGWEHTSTVGSIVVDPAGFLRLNDDGIVTTSGTYGVEDWEVSFRMYQGSNNSGNSVCTFMWNWANSGDDRFHVDIQRYSGINRSRFGFKVGGVNTTMYNSSKYSWVSLAGWFSYRVRKIGNTFYLKVWYQTDTEPVAWDYVGDHTNSFSNQGQIRFDSANSNSAGIDDIVIRDLNIQGYDKRIAITDYTGINQLPVEIENFNFIDRIANLWTKVPTIVSGTDTDIYLYYDSTQLDNSLWVGETGTAPALAVWDDDYYGVWHLAGSPDNTASSLKDSTDTGNHGTSVNMDGLADSILDGKFIGINTDGSNEYAQCGNDSTLQLTSNFSVECVAKTTSLASDALVSKTDSSNTKGWGLKLRNTTKVYLGFKISNSHYTALEGNTAFNTSDYYYFGFSYVGDGSNPTVVVNDWLENMGVVSSLGTGGLNGFTDSGENFEIGTGNIFSSSPTYHTGPIVEVRYSNTVRSSAWMKATYYTAFDDLMTITLGGSPPPPDPPEPEWQESWANFYEITIDKDRIDAPLTSFPVLVTLTSGAGINNFDTSDIFNHLTESGIDSYTSFMMPTDGDRSSSQHPIVFGYNPKITTLSGISCVLLNGTDQVMLAYDSDDWDFGSGDFTLEAWVYSNSLGNVDRIMSHGSYENNPGSWTWGIGYNGGWGAGVRMNFAVGQYTADLRSPDLSSYLIASVWNHLAAVRSGNTLYMFVNGQLRHSVAFTYNLTSAGTGEDGYLFLGCRRSTSRIEHLNGYITRCAVHKGVARWTSNFTPPTSPTNDQYTKFLYNAEGDGSQWKHNLEMVSDPEVHTSSPATDGRGYWYFDSSGTPSEDEIQVPHHTSLDLSTTDFTIEFYFKTIDVGNNRYLLTKRTGIPYANWVIIHHTSGYVYTYIANAAGTNWQRTLNSIQGTAPRNQWIYYTLVREGTAISVYLNGIRVHQSTLTGDIYDDGGPLNIGGRGNGIEGHYGYIQGLRISKGIARYTGNRFFPPDPPDGDSGLNRKKIQLADADHNRLYTEIEGWDHANKRAWLWAKVPYVASGTNTTLYLYYDRTQDDNTEYIGDIGQTPAQQVWTDDFSGVWHMTISHYHETVTPLYDSTVNSNHMSTGGFSGEAVFQRVDGLVTQGTLFENSQYYYDYTPADDESLDLTTNYTLEAMFIPTADDLVDQIICKAINDAGGYQLRGDSGIGPTFRTGTGDIDGRTNWQNYGWQYATAVCLVSGTILYLDGSYYDEGSTTGTPVNSNTFYIGRRWDGYLFGGIMSEIRVSNAPRSASYAKANYYNMWDNLLTWQEGQRPVYTASGTTTVDGLYTDGIPIRLYRRLTGELVGSTISDGGGRFTIDSAYDEEHYIIGLYTVSGTNALIFDWIAP